MWLRKPATPKMLKLMRLANTRASNKYSTGGQLKSQGHKAVTLPKLKSDADTELPSDRPRK